MTKRGDVMLDVWHLQNITVPWSRSFELKDDPEARFSTRYRRPIIEVYLPVLVLANN